MFWTADPLWQLIRHLFNESVKGLNPFAEESRQESHIILFSSLAVIGIITSFGALMPFFFGLPRFMAIEIFWNMQNELLLNFTALIGIISVLRWEPMQEGISRNRFFLSIISSRQLILAAQMAQLLFVLLLSCALNLLSILIFSLFVPEQLQVGVVFFFCSTLLIYTTLALLVFFLVQTIILFLRILHLSWLRYLLLSYLIAVIFTPSSLLRRLYSAQGIELIPYQHKIEPILRQFLSGQWKDYLMLAQLTLASLLVYGLASALFMQHRLIEAKSEPPHRTRSHLALGISRFLFWRPGPSRGIALHLCQSMLASRQLRTMSIVLLALLFGALNAELLSLLLLGKNDIAWHSQHLGSDYYFIVLICMSISFYYIFKLSVARRHIWVFQLSEPHSLFWSFKKAILNFLYLCGLLLSLVLAPFMGLLGGTAFALSHALSGLFIWSFATIWHSWNTEYIPFTALVEQDKLLFKRFWLVYFIAINISAKWLSRFTFGFTAGLPSWIFLLSLLPIAITHLILSQRQRDVVSLREPEFEIDENAVLVEFET